jgi:hypothetical protein
MFMSRQQTQVSSVLTYHRPLTSGGPEEGANAEDLGHVIERLHHELRMLHLERALIVKRIGAIKQVIAGLADVFRVDVIDKELQSLISKGSAHGTTRCNPGLTDVCRRALMESSEPLTVRQVCGRIQETNPPIFARQKHPTNSVTVVLRRLVSYGEVKDCMNERSVRAWLWIGPRLRDETVEHSSASGTGIATGTASPSPS